MKKSLLYIVVLLSLSACGGGEPKVPEDIMPKEKMVSVLEDVHILPYAILPKHIRLFIKIIIPLKTILTKVLSTTLSILN
jgi:hypothetical protein